MGSRSFVSCQLQVADCYSALGLYTNTRCGTMLAIRRAEGANTLGPSAPVLLARRLAAYADCAVVVLHPVRIVDIGHLHAPARGHRVDDAPAADIERDVRDAAVPAGPNEEDQIARLQVTHTADRFAVAGVELCRRAVRQANTELGINIAG